MHIYTLSTHIHLQTSPCFVAGTATGGADRIPSTPGRCLQGAPCDGVIFMGTRPGKLT